MILVKGIENPHPKAFATDSFCVHMLVKALCCVERSFRLFIQDVSFLERILVEIFLQFILHKYSTSILTFY